MDDRKLDLPTEVEERWREWSRIDPTIDEAQLKRNLFERTRDRRPRHHAPLVLAAVTASLIVIFIGIESTKQPVAPQISEPHDIVYEASENVILVLREGADPIYLLTEPSAADTGE